MPRTAFAFGLQFCPLLLGSGIPPAVQLSASAVCSRALGALRVMPCPDPLPHHAGAARRCVGHRAILGPSVCHQQDRRHLGAWLPQQEPPRAAAGVRGARNALQTHFLSVIVSNSPLAVPASQVSVCFKLFSPEASAAFFQIESHLFSTQVSNLSGALCIILQSTLPRTIYPNLVSSVNYINVPFSSSCM